MLSPISSKWQFWTDRGGTFTDCVGLAPNGSLYVTKVLSDQTNVEITQCMENNEKSPKTPIYSDIVRGIRRILNLQSDEPFPSDVVDVIKIGTTLGTNALLERRGSKCVYITTKGFKDALIIRYQTRPNIFALDVNRPLPLYHDVIEVDERVTAKGEILIPLDAATVMSVTQKLSQLKRDDPEIQSCAIVFLHSCLYPEHEIRIGEACQSAGFRYVYLSHSTDPIPKLITRAETTVVDAYLSPLLSNYIQCLSKELNAERSEKSAARHNSINGPQLLFMKSDGGLTDAHFFKGRDSLLSGPAGGAVGAWNVCQSRGINRVISFDMGGTSTDVCHIQDGIPHRLECDVGGVTLCRSSVDITTIASGGGSIVRFDGLRLLVGPQSAGSDPGPACYRQSGPLTITDCNVILGRIQHDAFPKLFGPNKNQPIDVDIVQLKFEDLQRKIIQTYMENCKRNNTSTEISYNGNENAKDLLPKWMTSVQGIAEQFIEIAIQKMVTAIKTVTSHKGIYLGDHTLCCYGGAGGQHACAVGNALGLKQVLIHPLASVLSAVGIGVAYITRTAQLAVGVELSQTSLNEKINSMSWSLGSQVSKELEDQNITTEKQMIKVKLRLGYRNTQTIIVVEYHTQKASIFLNSLCIVCEEYTFPKVSTLQESKKFISEELPPLPDFLFGRSAISLREEFLSRHRQEFGFCMFEQHPIDIATIEVEATSDTGETDNRLLNWKIQVLDNDITEGPNTKTVSTFFSGEWHDIPLLQLWDIPSSGEIIGPAMFIDPIGTNVILPGWKASWDMQRCLMLTRLDHHPTITPINSTTSRPSNLNIADPFWLELFNHYFQSVCEEMGVILQRTCQSINIKERLDFSCAMFDAYGRLVANAPHIPVHLGSMGDAVLSLIESTGNRFLPGQVFVSNNPFNGGTHLPDITVITPVFLSANIREIKKLNGKDIHCIPICFVASRGHHADVGGKTPGSMPAMSSKLSEEGVVFDNMLIVDPESGQFMKDEVLNVLNSGLWPARNPGLNIADLQAQVAANNRGVEELRRGFVTFGSDVMTFYMSHVLDGGEKCVKQVIKRLRLPLSDGRQNSFICHMDGGNQISVAMKIDEFFESIDIDFSHTSATDHFNYNAPMSVLNAAVLYVFRTLINDVSVPMNDGCFRPLRLHAPIDCIVNPKHGAAVAAGNVEISQCAVNALYGCLGILAGGQGTMNNIAFGNSSFQYYETLGGGTGASSHFNGCSAIHSHMTNSRMTDTELLESMIPIIVLTFRIRSKTGGNGQYRGGDGIIRSLLFLDNVECSILSGQREVEPFGLNGGCNGAIGRNCLLVRRRTIENFNCLISELKPFIKSLIAIDEDFKRGYEIHVLGSRDAFQIQCGDVLIIETPGGGGFGKD